MRVIQIVPAISEEASGPTYSVVRLCQSLIDLGEDITLSALDWAPLVNTPPFLKTFPLGLGPRRLGRSPHMKQWLSSQATTGNVDLIHDHSLWMMPNVYPGDVARNHRVPLVLSPRGTLSGWAMTSGSSFKRLFWRLAQKPVLESTACFHATSIGEYEDIRQLGFRQPVAIIPNGIDIPPFLNKSPCRYRTLLFLSRIHPVKGLDNLLHAWCAIQDNFPEWKLKIVGPDNNNYSQVIHALASSLSLKRIEFHDSVFGMEKWKTYRDSEIFVLPTYSENFGLAVAEALASGIPAIVSKGAPWSGLNENSAGWWVDIGIDPLVACLEQAMSLPDTELQVIGQRGRNWMERAYAWSNIGKKMAGTYKWLTNGGIKPEWIIED